MNDELDIKASAAYSILKHAAYLYREENDCTVKALAIVTHSTYDEAHACLAALGRKPRRGCNRFVWLKGVEARGYRYNEVTGLLPNAKTVKTLERELRAKYPGKRFLATVRGHICAFDGEKVIDWSRNSRCQIQNIWHVAADKNDLLPYTTRQREPEYTGHLQDGTFYWFHPEKKEHGEWRVYIRENGKYRWTNSQPWWDEDDAHEAAWNTANRRMIRFMGMLDPKDVEQD